MPELERLEKKQLGVVFLLASVRRCLRDAKKETAFWTLEEGGNAATHCYEALQSVDKALKSFGLQDLEAVERMAEKVATDYAAKHRIPGDVKEEQGGVQNQNG